MSEMNQAIDAAFSKLWIIGGAEVPCRYRYKDDTHTIKAFDGLKTKGLECVSPDGELFEVINSQRVNATTYEHTLQPKAQSQSWDSWER